MRNYLFFLLFCVSVSAQNNLTNITNYCANFNSAGSTANYTHFAEVGNLLLFRSPGDCASAIPEGVPFKIWAYDGVNTPYKLKFPDGSDFAGGNELEYNNILTLNGKVYLDCNSNDNTKKGLYVFDPGVSVTHLAKVVTDNFPDNCKAFRSLAKYNNGIVYTSETSNNCFYNPDTNTATRLFYDFRKGNFGYGGYYFSNAELNGNFYFTTIADGINEMEIKKYNMVSNTAEVIASTSTTISPYPNGKTVFANKLYYINNKDDKGVEIFQYDGTTETCLDINPGVGSSYPNLLTVVNNKMYFTCHFNNKYYLYKYDGNNPPEVVHESDFNLMDYYSGMCELHNDLYLIKSYSISGGGINTDLYKYSETTNTFSLVYTFTNFLTAISNWDFIPAFYGPIPQFYENKRGHLISFNNELYIIGRKLLPGNLITGAHNDIWKIDNGTLKTTDFNIITQNNIRYYPNPTKNDVNINLDKTYKSIEIYVTAADGKIVKRQNFSNTNYAKLQMPKQAGVYYMTIISDHIKSIYKIIKE